jgi:hypothetical protein
MTSKWNAKLPYPTETEWLKIIKENCSLSLKANHPSYDWVKALDNYLNLKYTLTLHERIYFIEILFNLIISLDLFDSLGFIKLCTRLLEKKIEPLQVELQWKPLYDLIQNILDSKYENDALAQQMLGPVIDLAFLASKHFHKNSTQEILGQILPTMSLENYDSFSIGLAILSILLPTHQPPSDSFYWTKAIFSLWQSTVNSAELDVIFMMLFSRLAKNQVSNPNTIGWTDEMIERIFNVGTKLLNLPIGQDRPVESFPLFGTFNFNCRSSSRNQSFRNV